MLSSLNVKLGVIALLALFMLVPLKLIEGKVSERSQYREQAARRIADQWWRLGWFLRLGMQS